jgi:hypothetical protein
MVLLPEVVFEASKAFLDLPWTFLGGGVQFEFNVPARMVPETSRAIALVMSKQTSLKPYEVGVVLKDIEYCLQRTNRVA